MKGIRASMDNFVNDIMIEVAEMLPAVTQKEWISTDELPIDPPNFPHDLKPAMRAKAPGAAPAQGALDSGRVPTHAATVAG
jgi:hypothetical protein